MTRTLTRLTLAGLLAVVWSACSGSKKQESDEKRTIHHHEDHGEQQAGRHGEPKEHAESADDYHRGHSFENAEEWAERFDDPKRDGWQKPEHVVELMKIEPGMLVADIGTGTGYFLPYLSKAVGAKGGVLALDIEPEMIEYVRKRAEREALGNVTANVVQPDDPQLGPGTIDRILIVNTYHHIGQREAYDRKLADALAPGGKVVIVDYTMEAERGPPKKIRLKPEEVVSELESAGLKAEVAEEELAEQYVVIATKTE